MLGSCMYASWEVDSREVDVAVTASNWQVTRWCGYGMLWRRWLLLQLQALQNIIKTTKHKVVGNYRRTVWTGSMILKPTITHCWHPIIWPQQLATVSEDTTSQHTTHWNACCMFYMNCVSSWMFSTPFAISSSLLFTETSYLMRGSLAVSSQVKSMLATSKSVH